MPDTQNEIKVKMLEYVQKSTQALKIASERLAAYEQNERAVHEKAAAIADRLVALGLIDSHEREPGVTQLTKHAIALDVFDNVLDEFSEVKAASVPGKPRRDPFTLGEASAEDAAPQPATKTAGYHGRDARIREQAAEAARNYLSNR